MNSPRMPPTNCVKCKSEFIQRVDSGFVDDSEYRDTYNCESCHQSWDNVYRFRETVKIENDGGLH